MRASRFAVPAGLTAALVAAVFLSGCIGRPHRERALAGPDCDFVVLNRTPHILEIRMMVRPLTSVAIGALNPGELLTHSAPCADHGVWIGGVPIPDQVGAPTWFRMVEGRAELTEGERVEVSLYWP